MDYEFDLDANGKIFLKIALSGYALVTNPLLNKGTAFSAAERETFNLLGIIPPNQTTLAIQRDRSYETLHSKATDIEKYIYLRDLQDSNETLFYSLLCEHISALMPIVYTPVVGLGCQRFSHIYRRPRGVYISYPDRHRIDKILAHPRFNYAQVIVVSDGERILGLGDQGAGGMGIPIGKLALYSACAGIYPAHTLPIFLDVGTNNPQLLQDPLYIGWHHDRIRGKEYDHFIAAFIKAVKDRFPHVLLQWEDFAQQNANRILEQYQDQLCTFNDDIQGTASVAAGTLLAAIHVSKIPLTEQRIVVVGAGSAGCGISRLIKQVMVEKGLSPKAATERFYLIDKTGLLFKNPTLYPFQTEFARDLKDIAGWQLKKTDQVSLFDVIKNTHPTLLIGVSGQPGIFTEEIVREMAKHVERPIIFPLSNPTERSEAKPHELLKWTNDKAIISTGSPFGAITKKGKTFRVDQTNNCYIFPGLGLGLLATKSQRVTNEMFIAAAKALADSSPAKIKKEGNLLPPIEDIREVSLRVAVAVAEVAIHQGLAMHVPSEPLEHTLKARMWYPDYMRYEKIS